MRLTALTAPAALTVTGAVLAAAALGTALPAAQASTAPAAAASTASTPPPVSPTPHQMTSLGGPIEVTSRVQLVTDSATDPDAIREVRRVLAAHGDTRVEVIAPGTAAPAGNLKILLGEAGRIDIRQALGNTTVPNKPEAYAVRSTKVRNHKDVVLAGRDAAGQFYAVQPCANSSRARATTRTLPASA